MHATNTVIVLGLEIRMSLVSWRWMSIAQGLPACCCCCDVYQRSSSAVHPPSFACICSSQAGQLAANDGVRR